MALTGATVDEIAAIFSVILSLAGTGASLFIWMAVAGWTDKAGVGAAVLFILMSAIQAAFSMIWYRKVKTVAAQNERELENLAGEPGMSVKA